MLYNITTQKRDVFKEVRNTQEAFKLFKLDNPTLHEIERLKLGVQQVELSRFKH